MLGYAPDDLLGRPLSAFLVLEEGAEGDAHALPAHWREALLRDEQIQNLEAGYRTSAAATVPVLFSAAKVKSARDELLGIVCVAKDVTEQRQAAQELRAQLQRIRQQQETINVLVTPIIQLWRRVLALPIVGEIDHGRAVEMMDRLLHAVVETRCEFIILDVTGLKSVDSLTTGHLLKMSRAARLLGAHCLVSGISPAIARSLVELGSDSGSLVSFRTLEAALRHALLRLDELPGTPAR
jgi:anti-anti-sigma factor